MSHLVPRKNFPTLVSHAEKAGIRPCDKDTPHDVHVRTAAFLIYIPLTLYSDWLFVLDVHTQMCVYMYKMSHVPDVTCTSTTMYNSELALYS